MIILNIVISNCLKAQHRAGHDFDTLPAERRSGVDPGFLERGYIYIKVWGFALLILSHFVKYSIKKKYFGLTETKWFHFHRIIN